MSEFIREINGRVAKAEISVYDAMMAEILRDRMAEKLAHRKHRENRERRNPGNASTRHLEKMCVRNWKTWMSGKTNADFRAESRERSLRVDWALEEAQITESWANVKKDEYEEYVDYKWRIEKYDYAMIDAEIARENKDMDAYFAALIRAEEVWA